MPDFKCKFACYSHIMKNLFILGILVFAACSQKPTAGSYGQKFENKGATDLSTALASYTAGKDTTYIIQGKIKNVCQGQGCWITFENGGSEFRICTKEAFTMPKNSQGKKATARGKFVKDEEGGVEFEPTGVIIE